MRLAGKVALIVGGGERMSRAAALLFAREGAKVAVAARRVENCEATVKLIAERGGQAIALRGDATDEVHANRMVEETVDEFGKLDVLYNNVGGGYARTDGNWDVNQEVFDAILGMNLRSMALCTRFALPHLIANGGGSIINVAAAPLTLWEGTGAYSAAKSGVIGYTQSLAREYWPQSIRANVISPGLIRGSVDPDNLRPVAGSMNRYGRAEDVAYAALWLASDEAAWVTGLVLPIDGGARLIGRMPGRDPIG